MNVQVEADHPSSSSFESNVTVRQPRRTQSIVQSPESDHLALSRDVEQPSNNPPRMDSGSRTASPNPHRSNSTLSQNRADNPGARGANGRSRDRGPAVDIEDDDP